MSGGNQHGVAQVGGGETREGAIASRRPASVPAGTRTKEKYWCVCQIVCGEGHETYERRRHRCTSGRSGIPTHLCMDLDGLCEGGGLFAVFCLLPVWWNPVDLQVGNSAVEWEVVTKLLRREDLVSLKNRMSNRFSFFFEGVWSNRFPWKEFVNCECADIWICIEQQIAMKIKGVITVHNLNKNYCFKYAWRKSYYSCLTILQFQWNVGSAIYRLESVKFCWTLDGKEGTPQL